MSEEREGMMGASQAGGDARRRRWRGASAAVATTLFVLGPMGGACVDTSTIFSGRWESQGAPLDGLLHGVPVLALGHYQREVAGVAYFMASSATGTLYEAGCPCAFVEHNTLDLDRGTVVFETQCGDTAPLVRWSLARVEDKVTGEVFLEGTVSRSDGQAGPVEHVQLLRVRGGLTDDERRCPPE